MRCRNCDHQNPEQNRYCGMCGKTLEAQQAAEPEYMVEQVPISIERAPSQRAVEAPTVIEPAERRLEPPQAKPLETGLAPAEPVQRSDKWWVDESETTVGGPSFLGLSGGGSNEGGYSYLFEDEERSHAGRWVFLVLLLALGGVLYAKWQPIRDYVLTTAISHSRPQAPSQDPKSDPGVVSGSSAPTTTMASSDAQPPITMESKAEANKAPAQKDGLPQQDHNKPAAVAPNPDDKTKSSAAGAAPESTEQPPSKPPNAKSRAAKDEASAGDQDSEDASAADEDKPVKDTRAPQVNPGGELVNSGERYLYGRGVARNCDQAVSYFNAAAAKQNPQAFSHLGALYATGECVPMDRAVAYAWFRRAYAKEPGNHYFEQNLTMLWREMTPGERQRATGNKVSSF